MRLSTSGGIGKAESWDNSGKNLQATVKHDQVRVASIVWMRKGVARTSGEN